MLSIFIKDKLISHSMNNIDILINKYKYIKKRKYMLKIRKEIQWIKNIYIKYRKNKLDNAIK